MATTHTAPTDSNVPADAMTVNCATGTVTCTPLTAAQVAARQAAASALAAQQQAAANARAQQVSTVAADTSPAIQALAKLLGIIP